MRTGIGHIYRQGELQHRDVEVAALTLLQRHSGDEANAGRTQKSSSILHVDRERVSK